MPLYWAGKGEWRSSQWRARKRERTPRGSVQRGNCPTQANGRLEWATRQREWATRRMWGSSVGARSLSYFFSLHPRFAFATDGDVHGFLVGVHGFLAYRAGAPVPYVLRNMRSLALLLTGLLPTLLRTLLLPRGATLFFLLAHMANRVRFGYTCASRHGDYPRSCAALALYPAAVKSFGWCLDTVEGLQLQIAAQDFWGPGITDLFLGCRSVGQGDLGRHRRFGRRWGPSLLLRYAQDFASRLGRRETAQAQDDTSNQEHSETLKL